MPSALKPRKYRLGECSRLCSLNERNLPAGAYESIHRWYEQGLNVVAIVANAKAMGWELGTTAVSNHKRKHMIPEDHFTPIDGFGQPVILDPNLPARKLSDLEILDTIIQAGSRQLSAQSIKISPEMTMKAMELRLKLTQGSVFDDFMAAVGQAFGAPDTAPSEAPENTEAIAEAMEQMQGAGPDDSAG